MKKVNQKPNIQNSKVSKLKLLLTYVVKGEISDSNIQNTCFRKGLSPRIPK